MALIIFRVTRSISAIVVCLWVIHHDSVMSPILGFTGVLIGQDEELYGVFLLCLYTEHDWHQAVIF